MWTGYNVLGARIGARFSSGFKCCGSFRVVGLNRLIAIKVVCCVDAVVGFAALQGSKPVSRRKSNTQAVLVLSLMTRKTPYSGSDFCCSFVNDDGRTKF